MNYGCKKKQDEPESNFKVEINTQIFPAATTIADTLQVRVGSICLMGITLRKGKNPIKRVTILRTNLTTNITETLKDTLCRSQNPTLKVNVSSNLGNISTLWRYEITAQDEGNITIKRLVHIRVGQKCPSLTLNFVGFTNSDSNRVKVQATGLPTGTTYQYSYDNGVSWTYSNEFTFKTSGTKIIYARDKNNPSCITSTIVEVTGKKILTHTVELGAEMNTTHPHFYDVEGKTAYFYSAAFSHQNVIDWVYRTYAGNSYLFSPKSAADSNYYNMNVWTTRLQSKFFNPVWVGEYNSAISSVEIKAAQRGLQKDVSPSFYSQICIPFMVVNSSNLVKGNGIAYVKEFQTGANGYAKIELKYYLVP
ncbi:MAG: hypothetical protein NZ455_15650 [Bacteroidia bacterium]|nr:hypothetical protein [Bacteroidia bacterium]MDW8347974.1 hypothetical protein [Bacteroidia bacterium]